MRKQSNTRKSLFPRILTDFLVLNHFLIDFLARGKLQPLTCGLPRLAVLKQIYQTHLARGS